MRKQKPRQHNARRSQLGFPKIDLRSACSKIFVRAYAESKKGQSKRRAREHARPTSWFGGRFLVLDSETLNHKMTFGAFAFIDGKRVVTRAVLFDDDLPKNDPLAFQRLREICRARGLLLYSLSYLFATYVWKWRNIGGAFTFFNASYDLSRLASRWKSATEGVRRGTRFVNGFTFLRSFGVFTDETGKPLLDESGQLRERIVERPFVRTRRDDRHHVRYDMAAAHVLDLATLAFALTDETHSLRTACEAFGIEFIARPGEHSGEVTPENVDGCLYDVQKTSELLFALGREYDRHPIDLPPWRAQSGASLAKSYLRAFGVAPRSVVQPDFPKEYQGYAATAYFGGRVEARIVDEPMPCAYLDAVSMYPTAFDLLNLWFGHVVPAHLEPAEIEPAEIQALLDEVRRNPRLLLDRTIWPRFAFFAQVDPNGAMLLSRPEIPSPNASESASRWLVSIGPITSNVPLWFAGPDLVAAAINGGNPKILRAWRLRPEGVQDTLRPVRFRGEDEIDPHTTNPFRRLIELRKRKSGNDLDDRLRSTGYKVIANSGAYGIFVETTPEDIDPDAERELRPVHVWGLSAFEAHVDRPETHSPLCFFPTASLVTAGARLLLAVAEYLVHEAGGEVAYCDTDSLMVVASEHGGLIPCTCGPYRLKDGAGAVRALSHAEVDRILDELASLNLYPEVAESSFKLEDENFDENRNRRELWFYGTREKSYALYAIDENGEPAIVKHSAHTIGQYSSPIPGDKKQRWIADAWDFTIRGRLGLAVEEPAWFNLPALSQLTVTTYNLTKHYRETCDPFDFVAVAQAAYPGMLQCCEIPRPSCQPFSDISAWRDQQWRCLKCGAPLQPLMADTDQSIFKSYARVVYDLARSMGWKRLPANGRAAVRRSVRGLTIPRPVHIESIDDIEHIGKEVIVDPTDIEEVLTAELLGETRVLIYENEGRRLDSLRARIRALGISKVARQARVSRSAVKAFVNQGKTPHGPTVEKLEAALRGAISP